VLVNNDGGTEGTLLELLQRCLTPFGESVLQESRVGRRLLMVC
jgi:DNA mismatch repair protein MSH6